MKNNLFSMLVAALAGVAAILAGCSSVPERNAHLEAARLSYQDAQGVPSISTLAAAELKEAGDALEQANAAWLRRENPATVEQLSYIAERRAHIAQEAAIGRRAEASVGQADTQSARIQLAARTEEADRSQARAAQLQSQLDELHAQSTDRGTVVTLGDVLFDTDQAQLKPGGVRVVQKLGDILIQNPQRRVVIEGFTDSTGSDSHNQALSERRAASVRDALFGMGIARDRIVARGYGKAYPVAGNDTEAGRQLNRRVEVIISDEQGVLQPR